MMRALDNEHTILMKEESYMQSARVVVAHMFVCLVFYSACYCFGIVTHWPTNASLITWDAGFFASIATQGYVYSEEYANVAFFPLFSYIWRWSQLTAVGISIVNSVCAGAGLLLLVREFNLTSRQFLLLLSTPALFIVYVPYTEAMFFLTGAVLLLGLHRRALRLVVVSLFLCCCIRAAATLFIPAYLFAVVLGSTWQRSTWLKQAGWLLSGLLAILAAVVLVNVVQYQATGQWLLMFKDMNRWGHKLQWPEWPFYSGAGVSMLWLDVLALAVTAVASGACLYMALKWLRRLKNPAVASVSPAVLFSLGYLATIGVYLVAYQGGETANATRYILATPFFVAAFWQLGLSWPTTASIRWGVGVAVLLMLGLVGIPFNFPSFNFLQALWYSMVVTLYLVAYVVACLPVSRWHREIVMGLYIINLLLQVCLFDRFLEGRLLS